MIRRNHRKGAVHAMEIRCFDDFCAELARCGFCLGAGGGRGIFALLPGWDEEPAPGSPIRWFTGEAETDPWAWRVRALEERRDIAYGKFFFGVSGYIHAGWFPDFYAVRRGGETMEEAYGRGAVSRLAKDLYEAIGEAGVIQVHALRMRVCPGKGQNAAFERAVGDLQARLFVTPAGFWQKVSREGVPYGWNGTAYTTVERFWQERGLDLSDAPEPKAAAEAIRAQVLRLNPGAREKDIRKFIYG